ncbi:MAG: cell division protein FtsA, partial [Thermoplasmata archaeon]|nr:cell division protein FtsA [Thermoplasmata archaeon]
EGNAEELKLEHGCALASMTTDNDKFSIPATIGRDAHLEPTKVLAEIIEFRMKEIFTIAKEEIVRHGSGDMIGAGIVLTGGASLLKGTELLARMIFNDMNVRIGTPLNITGNTDGLDNPIFATGIGLARYGADFRRAGNKGRFDRRNIFKEVLRKMHSWVKGSPRSE